MLRPLQEFRDTVANIAALAISHVGAIAYATDTSRFGTYDGTVWNYALYGTIPDNDAAAITIVDDGVAAPAAVEYMRIDSRNGPAQAIIFNNGEVDVDFRVATLGETNSLFVQGSDGFTGLNVTPLVRLHILDTGTQFRIDRGAGDLCDFTVDAAGGYTIAPSGGDTLITGTLDVSGHVAFGGAASISVATIINASEQFASAGNVLGLIFNCSNNPGAGYANTTHGAFIVALSQAGNAQNWTRGAPSFGLVGVEIAAQHNGTATITSAAGGQFQVQNLSSGIISNTYGTYIENATNSGGGTITTQFGLYIENLTSATNNYGIYVSGAATYAIWVDSGITRLDDNIAAPGTAAAGVVTNRYGGATNFCGDPDIWLRININGTDYKFPGYL